MQDVNRQLPREERNGSAFPPRRGSHADDIASGSDAGSSSWIGSLLRGLVTIALVGAVLIAGWAFQRYLIATKPPTPQRATQELPRRVDTIRAMPADIQPTLKLYGQIAAGRSVDLRVLVGGEVKSISPELVEGGAVKPGDVLVKVDPFEFEGALVRARAELAESEARLAETRAKIVQEQAAAKRAREQMQIAEREVERFSTLRERGATSDATLDAGRTRLSVAQAAVESRANQILVLQAQLAREDAALDRLRWNVRKASRDIENTTLNAPFGGIVSNVAAEAGRLLNVNDRVATLVDLDRIEARFTLSDAQYGRLVAQTGRLEGRAVKVRWTGGTAELTATGGIDRVSPSVVAGSGGFELFARLKRSAATEALRPGAFVTIETPDVVFEGVVQVPASAVHPGSQLFRIDDGGRLQPIAVAVAGYAGSDVLVRGAIPEGAVLMTSRLPDAGPGVLVSPR